MASSGTRSSAAQASPDASLSREDNSAAGDTEALAASAAGKAALVYPFTQQPEPGQTLEVAPGVHWIRMGLPFALNHINLWAIDDGEGWTVVDCGLRNEETTGNWRKLFSHATDGRRITRVIVTHMHPDHVGLAGWLTRKFDCRLWITQLEYLHCRTLVSDTGREAPPDALAFFHRAGWSDVAIDTYKSRFGNFGKFIHTLPDSYRRLQDGEKLRIGGNDWQVVVGNGHSPEHACLYCPALKLFISGDQILPRISSNVSVHPTEPDANPMADWYRSLDKIQRSVPADVLVLPAHNDPFHGLHDRIDHLRRGQDRALERLRRSLREPRRAVDVFGALFARSIDPADVQLLGMATGEGLACLNLLVHSGEVQVEADADGVNWYRLAQTGLAGQDASTPLTTHTH